MVDPSPTDSMPTTTATVNTTTGSSETTTASTTTQSSTSVTTPGDDSWMDDTGVWLVAGKFYPILVLDGARIGHIFYIDNAIFRPLKLKIFPVECRKI